MNNKIRLLTHESYPCWYELATDIGRGLMLRIHTDAAESIAFDFDPSTAWSAGTLASDFRSDPRSDIGFKGNLKLIDERAGFFEYSIPLPECWKLTSTPQGNRHMYVYDDALLVLSSLGIVLDGLHGFTGPTNATEPQLMRVLVSPALQDQCSAITGDFSRELAAFLGNCSAIACVQAENAATDAFKKMDKGVPDKYLPQIRVFARGNGSIGIESSPSRASLYPVSYSPNTNSGYEFMASGFSDPMTQFAFIAALAKLNDLARNRQG